MKSASRFIVFSTLLLIVACGEDPGQRALSGAGIGAAGGAVGGAILGGNPLLGAAVGGAAGAAVGGLTSPRQIDLDK
jgi:hypothetical protein